MLKHFCIFLSLHLLFLQTGNASSTSSPLYAAAVASSHCGEIAFDMRDLFITTPTLTQTSSPTLGRKEILRELTSSLQPSKTLDAPLTTMPSQVVPATVIDTANTAGKIASTASVIAISPGGVTQGARIATLATILTCNENDDFIGERPDFSASPTQASIPWGSENLNYVWGTTLGNWAVFAGLTLLQGLLAWRLNPESVRFPGLLALPGLFLSAATTQASVTMVRHGNTVEKVVGGLALAGQVGTMGAAVVPLLPSRFGAAALTTTKLPAWASRLRHLPVVFSYIEPFFVEQKWHAKSEAPHFKLRYGQLFQDYRQERYWFIAPELFMTFTTGAIAGVQQKPESTCNTVIYVSTGAYTAYTLSLLILRPHRSKFDRIYFGGVAAAQALALILESIRRSTPAARNSTALAGVAQGIPVALQYITVARAAYDVAYQLKNLYKYYNRASYQRGELDQRLLTLNDQELEAITVLPTRGDDTVVAPPTPHTLDIPPVAPHPPLAPDAPQHTAAIDVFLEELAQGIGGNGEAQGGTAVVTVPLTAPSLVPPALPVTTPALFETAVVTVPLTAPSLVPPALPVTTPALFELDDDLFERGPVINVNPLDDLLTPSFGSSLETRPRYDSL